MKFDKVINQILNESSEVDSEHSNNYESFTVQQVIDSLQSLSNDQKQMKITCVDPNDLVYRIHFAGFDEDNNKVVIGIDPTEESVEY